MRNILLRIELVIIFYKYHKCHLSRSFDRQSLLFLCLVCDLNLSIQNYSNYSANVTQRVPKY